MTDLADYAERWRNLPPFGTIVRNDCVHEDVLRMHGWTTEEMRAATELERTKTVAELLGISFAHSIFLFRVNNAVSEGTRNLLVGYALAQPETVLGKHAPRLLKFWNLLHKHVLFKGDWQELSAYIVETTSPFVRAALYATVDASLQHLDGRRMTNNQQIVRAQHMARLAERILEKDRPTLTGLTITYKDLQGD